MNGLMTTRSVSQALGVSTQTIRNLVERGEMTAYRIGTRLRFDADEIKQYMKHAKTKGGAR